MNTDDEPQVSHHTIELPTACLSVAELVPIDAWQLFDNCGPLDTRTCDEPVCVRIQYTPGISREKLASLLNALSGLLFSEGAVH